MDLKPCPFCGSDKLDGPEISESENHTSWWIECPSCEYVMEDDTSALLLKKWNQRSLGFLDNVSKLNQARMRTRWQEIKKCGYPPKESDPFYGGRYSVPVLAGNEVTGQVSIVAYAWDYQMTGWVYATLSEGADPCDYEVQHVSHWALWPKCKLVCIG